MPRWLHRLLSPSPVTPLVLRFHLLLLFLLFSSPAIRVLPCFARCFSLSIDICLSLPPGVYSYSHRTSSPVMFHFDFPKFPARCQMVVDWIGLFTVVHLFPSETSFGSFPREIRWYFLISASRSRLGPTAGDVSHTKRKTGNIHIYICVCMCVFFLRNRS